MSTVVNRKNLFKPIIGGNEFSKLGVVYVLVSPSRRSLARASFVPCIPLFNEIHISNLCAIYCFPTAPCLILLLLSHTVLPFMSACCLVSMGVWLLCFYWAEVVVYYGLLATRCPFPRIAEASPSKRAANPKDENSQLTKLVMNLEEKISSQEIKITVLNSELDECRLWIPEPKAYGGARDAKEVENFLFDMQQYFFATNIEDEARKAILREAIREQFFPKNVEYNARRALQKLEHTSSMRDYVKAFSVAEKKTVPPRAGNIALALTVSHLEEEAQPQNPNKKELMFVDVKIHGKPIRAIIDTGTTHNYLASAEVERLRLVLEKGIRRVKAINSVAQLIAGVAKSVLIKVAPFEGKTNFFVVVMNNFKLILGLDFL
ncbi:UNVERIFIED_CONTAM: hypothetical protein Scaly_0460900 [Sesamum calycinum]|uniref:Retrotransposon gag domain-containing protein n=1 Tax=Sesamum calycinum TaxID=2727403 RepID=A0AAW2SH61_9LAMI